MSTTPRPAPDTVTEAVSLLEAEGYGDDLIVTGTSVECRVCGSHHALADVLVERVYRFEGPSDPADEAIVLGVRCPKCGARGIIVSAFGPNADPEVLGAVAMLASRT
jgi:DNA-directed RNA polymerase subunit RPC12/RpoP